VTPTTLRGPASRERAGVLGLAALIVVTVAVYLALKASSLGTLGAGTLLPYQALVATLVSSDQAIFADLQRQMVDVEAMRAAGGAWPEAAKLANLPAYTWTASREGYFVNYLATPAEDVSAAAWLLMIQEPDPQAPPDPAPNDETHHRLPDGTVLHVSIWAHRFGGQVARKFVRQPEAAGWTQVLTAPVPPVAPQRK
jgi:hypothetical protein